MSGQGLDTHTVACAHLVACAYIVGPFIVGSLLAIATALVAFVVLSR